MSARWRTTNRSTTPRRQCLAGFCANELGHACPNTTLPNPTLGLPPPYIPIVQIVIFRTSSKGILSRSVPAYAIIPAHNVLPIYCYTRMIGGIARPSNGLTRSSTRQRPTCRSDNSKRRHILTQLPLLLLLMQLLLLLLLPVFHAGATLLVNKCHWFRVGAGALQQYAAAQQQLWPQHTRLRGKRMESEGRWKDIFRWCRDCGNRRTTRKEGQSGLTL